MSYRPPHGTLDFFFAGPKAAKEMRQCNANYTRGYVEAKGRLDAQRRK